MEFLDILDNFFRTYKKAIDFYQLMKLLDIKAEEKDILEKGLYQLQIQGKVYQDEYGNYMHVSKDFYLKSGFVILSNKGNFYIKLNGVNIHLKKNRDLRLEKDDFVFVELVDGTTNGHAKYREAEVKSVVRKPISMEFPSYLVKGVIHETDRHVFLLVLDNKVIEVDKAELGTAYHGDVVTAEIYEGENKVFARVKEVLERKSDIHVYEYCRYQGNLCWVPVGTNYYPVMLSNEREFAEHDKILARVLIKENDIVMIDCLEKLDQRNENLTVANEIISRYNFSPNFSEEALAEANNLEFGNIDNNRVDYTNLKTVTIDGDRAKDFDDAISIERHPNGNYVLYVHIADVTHYVKNEMFLYQDAYKRGTSVYLEDFVFPMFPERLSNDLCSLNPNQLKLTVTCKMEIDSSGKVVDYFITESVIKSKMRMTYSAVDNILENGIIQDGYNDFVGELILMKELSAILTRRKIKRGYTWFDNTEVNFEFDANGRPVNVIREGYSVSREIIENFMLAANETVASYLYYLDVPTLYRNHEAPKKYSLEKIIYSLKKTGYLKGKINDKDPFFVAKLLKRYRGKKEFSFISKIILKSMTKAYYDSTCRGHFGLSLYHYLHFTSPIRRFPDIKVHEALKRIWSSEVVDDNYLKSLKEDGIHLSERELAANDAERDYHHYLLDLYVCDYLGKEVEAEVIFIDNDYLYLRALGYVDGVLNHQGNYDKDYKQVLFDGKKYQVGDKINVVLRKFSKDLGQYIFTVERESEKKLVKKR